MSQDLAQKFEPSTVEDRLYNFWIKNKFFQSKVDATKEAYTVVIPPPNVTGILHMGHMLNNTLQDVLVRRARMQGFNACWVPGTDHASIATEAKVVNKLAEKNISKSDLGREEFLKHCWDWTDEHGGIILEQLKKIGASCDWDRTKFTLDKELSESVTKTFVKLHNEGLIYRGYRMVNWDPVAKTTISDEEVIFKEKNGLLYYIKYQLENSEEYLTVATTRPETLFGDTAVCVHPEDERFKHFIGKKVIVPICNRAVEVIADDYVDIEFGTGALKITPAHDINDKEIGEKHNLEVINIFTESAELNEQGLHYQGKDRFVVRKEVAKELEANGLLIKKENYANKVGTSERSGAVIEPRVSVQWFLKMKDLAKPALDNVENDTIQFFPAKFKNTYRHWMSNIKDWNISRQLWWGHRIPAFFYGEGVEDFVVAQNIEEAVPLAQKKLNNPNLTVNDLKQDEDALDTWFSSWLWPMSVFDGVNHPDSEEINHYYPTATLVTGPDIIFFWVARMIMAGYYWRGEFPFKNVYFTGIVRDNKGRKMSKSLGNSPDPIKLMQKYGADGVRAGLMMSASAGNDLLFDEELCEQGRNFSSKMWNALRLLNSWEVEEKEETIAAKRVNDWMLQKIEKVKKSIDSNFEQFRLSDAQMDLYKLIWEDYCSWYLESIKPVYGEKASQETVAKAKSVLDILMKLLHPFMPFVTEEIWQNLEQRGENESICVATYPELKSWDEKVVSGFESNKEVVSAIRKVRNEKGISPKVAVQLVVKNLNFELEKEIISHLANTSEIVTVEKQPEKATGFMVGVSEFFIPLEGLVDSGEEKEKLEAELKYLKGFLISIQKKLSNEKFVSGAPEAVVNNERKKEADALSKITSIESQLKNV